MGKTAVALVYMYVLWRGVPIAVHAHDHRGWVTAHITMNVHVCVCLGADVVCKFCKELNYTHLARLIRDARNAVRPEVPKQLQPLLRRTAGLGVTKRLLLHIYAKGFTTLRKISDAQVTVGACSRCPFTTVP